MASYQDRYKAKNGFGDIKNNRAFRTKICEIKRKDQRIKNFAKHRELEADTDTNTDYKDNTHRKLLKWKTEREERKKMEQIKKKPPFKVGVVHHSYYSPPVKNSVALPSEKECSHGRKQIIQPVTSEKRITRATQKRLMKKEAATKEVSQKQNVIEKKQELLVKKEKGKDSVKNDKKSFAPANYKFTAPSKLKNIPLFGTVPILNKPVKPSPRELKNIPLFGTVPILNKPVKTSISVEKENKEKVFLSKKKSKSSNTEYDTAEINKKDATFEADKNHSIEAVTLQLSPDEGKLRFDYSSKEEEFLRNSTPSINSRSKIISPWKISPVVAKDESDSEVKIPASTSISDTNIKSEKSTSTINDPTTVTSALRDNSVTSANTSLSKDPVYFSPYIVSSRGKNNARKEQQIRRGIGCSPSENIPTKETVMKTLNISIEEEERTAQYFSFMLSKETDRLNELCKKWTEVQSESDITEDAQYQINQAVGQTRLLINKKFERFRGLVSDCETGKGEMLVTCRDLQGFWDMMYMEVMNCDSRFEALEKLRSNDWKEEEIAVTKAMPKKKVGTKKKIVSKKKSSAQEFILAAKKKMKNNTTNSEILQDPANKSINRSSSSINNIEIEQNKNEVFRKSDTKQSKSIEYKDRLSILNKRPSSRQSLLHKTLLSESSMTPMTIMKISQMCKAPKIELDDSISYINCNQTPSKSILKRTDDSTINETHCITRSMQKVNFDDHIILKEVPIDEEVQNKLDLAVRLAKIDNCDLDAEYTNYGMRVAKKLNLEDNSPLDSTYDLDGSTEELCISVTTDKNDNTLSNFEAQLVENTSSKDRDVSFKTLPEKSMQNETNTKILRNRIISTNNSGRLSTGKKSTKGLVNEDKDHQKENKTPVRSKKKSSRSLNKLEVEEPVIKKEPLHTTPTNLRKDLRRSSRKSVRFNAEECSACTEHKPVQPMTPHTRRSKGNISLNYLQGNDVIIQSPSPDTNLISWDTPKVPTRVRRSCRSSTKSLL